MFSNSLPFYGGPLRPRILFAPADEAGADTATTETTTTETTAAETTAAETATTDTTAAGAKWWDGNAYSDDQRASLTALGLTVDDPNVAIAKLVDMEASAKRRLGAAPDQLITKPKEGQELSAWMRENGELFGIPEAPDKYEIKAPENWPKDAPWDSDLEAKAREIAHAQGIPAPALQEMVNLFAGKVQQMESDAESQLASGIADMETALKKDWGDQYGDRMTLARQAMAAVAEEAGLSQDDRMNLTATLSKSTGDPQVVRMFAAIGAMMGEDSAVGLGKGARGMGDTPAEARAKLAQLRAPDGAYYKATLAGNQTEIDRLKPEIERLTKLAAQ